jgi:hypothetical protein
MPAAVIVVEQTAEEKAAADRIEKIISDLYYDKGGYLSVEQTYRNALKKDKTIKKKDVQAWFHLNTVKKNNVMGPQGKNSFVAPHKGYEYQIDLFWIKDMGTQENEIGFVMIDIFTKYATVIPLSNN